MDAHDRQLFEASLQQLAAQHGSEFDTHLTAVGWRDALAADPAAATATLFAVQGRHNVSSSALDDVMLTALGLPVAGETAIVLPALGEHVPPARLVDGRMVVRGVGTRRLRMADDVVIVASHNHSYVVVHAARTDLDLRAVDGMDPAGGWVEISANLDARGLDPRPAAWASAMAAGRLAIAQELAAASRSMLDLARGHAVERIQFGRPIGSFQAVRHRLADSLLAVESADAAIAVGWVEPSPFTAAMAKAIAGRSARTVARHAQQVLAGMGFTSEHAFHHYLKRTLLLDQLLGSGAAISAEIGTDAIRNRQLPSMLAL